MITNPLGTKDGQPVASHVVIQQGPNGVAKGVEVIGLDQSATRPGGKRQRRPVSVVPPHHWQSARHRLDRHEPKVLMHAREDKHGGGAVRLDQLGAL